MSRALSPPNTFVTIYGANLAFVTRAVTDLDIRADTLPTILPNTGVTVTVNHIRAQILYVSPGQINLLIPSDAFPGPAQIQVSLDNLNGPAINITIAPSAPALFQVDASTPIAVHTDGSLLTPSAPAIPGEIIVLYATGLGSTVPQAPYGVIPRAAAVLANLKTFRIVLDGQAIDPALIYYAGVAPGFAGLYQVNLRLPPDVGANPEIRLECADTSTKTGLRLPVSIDRPSGATASTLRTF